MKLSLASFSILFVLMELTERFENVQVPTIELSSSSSLEQAEKFKASDKIINAKK